MNLQSGEAARVQGLAAALNAVLGNAPEVAVILGSGWKESGTGLLAAPQRIPLHELADWPRPRVPGHGGEILLGDLGGRRTLLCTGRVHAYEGHPARVLVRGVRALAAWGARRFLLLNAAGSLAEERAPGSLMPVRDHLNLGLPNPLGAAETPDGQPVFLDLGGLYDPEWRAALLAAEPELAEGVYAGLPGPSYETPAEVQMLRALGADAVGMSTVPEALAARAAGARVMAVSLLTNWAAGIRGSRPSHGEVLETAAAHGGAAARVLAAAVRATPATA